MYSLTPVYEELTKDYGIYLDIHKEFDALENVADYKSLGGHCNDRGYALIADLLFNSIKKIHLPEKMENDQ